MSYLKNTLLAVATIACSALHAQHIVTVSAEGEKGTHATVEKALAEVSKMIDKNGYPLEGIEIRIKDGYYKIEDKIVIGKKLSGTKENPLVIEAENPSKVHLFGGTILDFKKFKKFKASQAGFTLVDEKAASKIKVLDLKKSGLSKSALGKFVKHGYGFEKNPNFTTPAMLWVDGERMRLSRWPNVGELNPYYDSKKQFKGNFSDVEIKGAVSLVDVVSKGEKKKNMWFQNKRFMEQGGGTFKVDFDRGSRWNYASKSKEKIWLDGVLSASWEWEYTQVKEINGKEITMASVQTMV